MERGLIRLKIFVTGGSSGVGQALVNKLKTQHDVVAPSRKELDLTDFEAIDQLDLSSYDIVINCAGANAGSYNGWQHNTWVNQQLQVDVNFTGALLLAKQYTKHKTEGQFIFVTSSNIDDPIAYNIFYTASKAALRYSINTLRRECPGIVFTEICPGKIKSNMLAQNYQGSKTAKEIEQLYEKSPYLMPQDIVTAIETTIKYKLDQITITPHD